MGEINGGAGEVPWKHSSLNTCQHTKNVSIILSMQPPLVQATLPVLLMALSLLGTQLAEKILLGLDDAILDQT